RSDRAGDAHVDAGLGGPARAVLAILDKRHAVPKLALGLRGEQIRRQPGQIEVAIGRNAAVLHGAPPEIRLSRATVRALHRRDTRYPRMGGGEAMRWAQRRLLWRTGLNEETWIATR